MTLFAGMQVEVTELYIASVTVFVMYLTSDLTGPESDLAVWGHPDDSRVLG